MAIREYKTIIDEIEAELRQHGHEISHATFASDRITFSGRKLQEAMEISNAKIREYNQTPVSGPRQDPTPTPDNEKSKQVKLPPSSTIQAAAYWPTKQYLVVSFKSGHTYSYTDVPIQTIQWWMQATSAGSWFYYNIRMSYRYQKMG